MRQPPAVLLHSSAPQLSASLRNHLLSAGYPRVFGAATAREALAELRARDYGYVLIELADPIKRAEQLACVVARRWPQVRVICLASAAVLLRARGGSGYRVIIKEHVFSTLLAIMSAGSEKAEHTKPKLEK